MRYTNRRILYLLNFILCYRGMCRRHVSNRPSVRRSQSGVLRRWLNLESRKQRHTIAQGHSLLMSKISAKFRRSYPQRGHQI